MRTLVPLVAAALVAALGPAIACAQDETGPGVGVDTDRIGEILSDKKESPAEDAPPAKDASPGQEQASQEGAPPEQAPAAPTLEQQIDQAIDRAVQWLFENQKPDGGWGGEHNFVGELHPHLADVFGLMGLAYGGVPAEDERLQKALHFVLKADLDQRAVSYAMRVRALGRLLGPSATTCGLDARQQAEVTRRLREDIAWLVEHQSSSGGWNAYRNREGTSSLITSIVVTSVDEGIRAVDAREKALAGLWKKVQDFWVKTQLEDGGWTSTNPNAKSESAASTSAGGLVSLLIARENLSPSRGCPCRGQRSPSRTPEADEAAERGLAWLNERFDPATSRVPGGDWPSDWWRLWCLRIGKATGLRFFTSRDRSTGTVRAHDWRPETARFIVSRQSRNGHWGAGGVQWVANSMACLAEARGWQPPLVNKLAFAGQWNNHPTDMRNLTAWLSAEKKEPLGWQAIPLEAKMDVWLEAPILYLSAEEPILPPDKASPDEKERFTKNLRDKLRRYTDSGGTLLVEASCGARDVVGWWENTCEAVWPEWAPDRPRQLATDHALWTADVTVSPNVRGRLGLRGIDDGVRTVVFFSRADISCDWNGNDVKKGKVTFDLGRNLCAYATDGMTLAEWRARRASDIGAKYAGQTLKAGPKTDLTLARLKHGGQWNVGDNYCPCKPLAACLKDTAGVTLKQAEPVTPGDEIPAGIDILWLCGRSGCDLGEGGPAWLKKALDAGAFLLAEATLGDARFDESFRAQLQTAGLTLKAFGADSPPLTGKLFDATGYAVGQVAYSPALAEDRKAAAGKEDADEAPPAVVLHGVYDGSKLVGVYSPYDMMFSQTGCVAFGNRGYAPDDARALATNLVLLVTAR